MKLWQSVRKVADQVLIVVTVPTLLKSCGDALSIKIEVAEGKI